MRSDIDSSQLQPQEWKRGSPFGPNTRGLELWNDCTGTSEEVERIRSFLLKEAVFDGTLKALVETAPAKELFERLIAPLHWDLATPDASAVEAAVERKLVNHGETTGIPPSHAKRVASRLLRHVAGVASAKGARRLHRADFLELFEAETRISVPQAQQEATMQTLARLLGPPAGATDEVISTSALQTTAPPLPSVFAPRTRLVENVKRLLASRSLVVLQGSTGMGKTVIAALVVSREPSFLWTSLRGLSPREIAGVLILVARSVDSNAAITRVVLDDIDFSPEHVRAYERILVGLVYTLASRTGWILATSQRAFPPRCSAN